jgi:hypothetical protein
LAALRRLAGRPHTAAHRRSISSIPEPSSLRPAAMEMEPPNTGKPETLALSTSTTTPADGEPQPNPEPDRLKDNHDFNRLTWSKKEIDCADLSFRYQIWKIYLFFSRKMTSNEKCFNYKVIDLVESYKFPIKFMFIRVHKIKFTIF